MMKHTVLEGYELAVNYQPIRDWRNGSMTRIIHGRWKFAVLICIVLSISSSLMAQQKGQYQPGQYGLNAGVLPDPGITYADYNLNYNAGQLNFANGTPAKVTGSYNIWAMENILLLCSQIQDSRSEVRTVYGLAHTSHGLSHATVPGEWGHRLGTGGLVWRIRGFNREILAGICRGPTFGRRCFHGAHRPLHSGRHK